MESKAILTKGKLKKAFDIVNHPILFAKLEHYGIRGAPLDFFKSYLCNRKQYVHCNNTSSYTTTIDYGVPQGSVLGPLLFIIYVNDIVNAVDGKMIRLFADDTAMFVQGNDVGLVYNNMKKGLIQLKEWFSCKRLTLNLAKACYSIYHGPKKKFPRLYDTMALNGQIINRQSCVKDLGLTIDETFNRGQHVNNLAKSLSKYYGIFNRIKHMIPKRHKMTIFNSFVHSKICYGI